MGTVLEVTKPDSRRFSAVFAYAELFKARVTSLVVLTAWCGGCLAATHSGRGWTSPALLEAALGVGLVAAGTAALNQVLERDIDAKMHRTMRRPLVTGVLEAVIATRLAIGMVLAGLTVLAWYCNWLTAVLTLLTSAVYLGLYTPLKTYGPCCTLVGAFPGAMPPLLGWVAVRGRLGWEPLVLFLILFFWQFPHFHAIGLLYRDDYRRAGIRMLAVLDTGGRSIRRSIFTTSLALLPVTLFPTFLHMAGRVYFGAAVLLGLGLLFQAHRAWEVLARGQPRLSRQIAARLLRATVVYLPALFLIMVLDPVR